MKTRKPMYSKACRPGIIPVLLFAIVSALLMPGCKDDDDNGSEGEVPNTYLSENTVVITDVEGIPDGVTFDRITAEIQGFEWDVIGVVEVAYKNGRIVLPLPAELPTEKLCKVTRDDWTDYTGFWPAATDNKGARVAGLKDIIAYDNDKAVGRFFLTDWSGKGSKAEKSWIYYHYTDQPFTLSGYNYTNPNPDALGNVASKSFRYHASFEKGWNAYVNTPISDNGIVVCSTTIPEKLKPVWKFESWVH